MGYSREPERHENTSLHDINHHRWRKRFHKMALDDLAGSEEYFTGHRSEISTSDPHYAETADLKKELKLDYCGINLALFGFLGSTIGLLGAALIASRVDYVSL